jgi:dihydroorotate dehydrogenase
MKRPIRTSLPPDSTRPEWNLGKSKVTPLEEAAPDYLYSFLQLAPVAHYIALNVSSPNTLGLRTCRSALRWSRSCGS